MHDGTKQEVRRIAQYADGDDKEVPDGIEQEVRLIAQHVDEDNKEVHDGIEQSARTMRRPTCPRNGPEAPLPM